MKEKGIKLLTDEAFTTHLFALPLFLFYYYYFSVYYAPIMNFTQNNITINETDSTTLHCNATGNPAPVIKWWRIQNSSAIHLHDGETLILRNVHRNDSGDYRCTASNRVGNPAVSHVNVNVQCKF